MFEEKFLNIWNASVVCMGWSFLGKNLKVKLQKEKKNPLTTSQFDLVLLIARRALREGSDFLKS